MKKRKRPMHHVTTRPFGLRLKRYKPSQTDLSDISFLEDVWIPLLKQKLSAALDRLFHLKGLDKPPDG